jgi:hypothetical protein
VVVAMPEVEAAVVQGLWEVVPLDLLLVQVVLDRHHLLRALRLLELAVEAVRAKVEV